MALSIRKFFNDAVSEGLAVVRQAAHIVADFIAPTTSAPLPGNPLSGSQFFAHLETRHAKQQAPQDDGIKRNGNHRGAARPTVRQF